MGQIYYLVYHKGHEIAHAVCRWFAKRNFPRDCRCKVLLKWEVSMFLLFQAFPKKHQSLTLDHGLSGIAREVGAVSSMASVTTKPLVSTVTRLTICAIKRCDWLWEANNRIKPLFVLIQYFSFGWNFFTKSFCIFHIQNQTSKHSWLGRMCPFFFFCHSKYSEANKKVCSLCSLFSVLPICVFFPPITLLLWGETPHIHSGWASEQTGQRHNTNITSACTFFAHVFWMNEWIYF